MELEFSIFSIVFLVPANPRSAYYIDNDNHINFNKIHKYEPELANSQSCFIDHGIVSTHLFKLKRPLKVIIVI